MGEMNCLALFLALHIAVSLCPESCSEASVLVTQKGDGICNAECNSPRCGLNEESDCLEECTQSGCQSNWLADGTCNTECSTLVCGLDRGDCGYCSLGCYLYMLEDEMCQEACFVPECDFDRGMCESCAPLCFTDEIYVYEGTQAWDGSAADPYSKLSTAIEAASRHLTVIYLLGSRLSFSFPESILSPILIRSLTCEERQSRFCSNEITTIDVATAASFTVSVAVTFQRVVFTTIAIFERLEAKGCPALTMQEGVWIDKDNRPASEDSIAAWNACLAFGNVAVFSVEGGSLTLTVTITQAVNVTDLLMQPKAFVQVKSGNVLLEAVHFEGMQTLQGSDVGAVILTTGDCSDCEVSFSGGSVHHLNDGFQYLPDAKCSPFLSAESFHSLEVSHVSFKFNTVIDAYSSVLYASTHALFYLGNFHQVTLFDCEFHSNFVSGGLIVIESEVQVPREVNADNVVYQLLVTHIDLQHISFRGNFAEHCLISIFFIEEVLNVNLADAEFLDNAIEGKYFIDLESQNSITEALAFGTVEEVYLNSGEKQNVWVPPRTLIVQGVVIRNSHSFNSLFYIRSLVNVNISSLEFSNNGNFDPDVLSHTFASCCAAAPVVPSFPSAPSCGTLLQTDYCFLITLTSLEILRNSCEQGSLALITSISQGPLKVSNLVAEDNWGSSELGVVIGIYEKTDFEGDFITFRNNTNDMGPLLFFDTLSEMKLSHSLFEDNIGVNGGVVIFYLAQHMSFRNCTFRQNTALDSIGGVAVWWVGNYLTVTITVEDCVFESNAANHGGVFAFENNNATTVLLLIKRTLFIGNSADFFGSVVYVTEPLIFSRESMIEDSTFEYNTAAYGVVWLMHTNALHFSRCLFQYNYGSVAAVVYIETPAGAVTLFEDVRFLSNYGSHTIVKSNPRTNSTFISRNCTFRDNPAGNVALEGGFWQDFSSTFTLSQSSQLFLSSGAVAQLTNAKFSDNVEANNGAAVHGITGSVFECVGCLFANNSAGQSGGAIYTAQETTVYIDNCMFIYNSAGSGGGAFWLSSSLNTPSVVSSSVLKENSGGNFGVIFTQDAIFQLDNVTIEANTGEGCPGITLLMSHATISNSIFQSMSGLLAAFLSIYTSSSVDISSTKFAHGRVSYGGAIYLSSLSNLTISKSTFHNVSCGSGGAVTALSSSRVALSEVAMESIESGDQGSLLYLSESSLVASACEFSSFRGVGIYGYQLSEVAISASAFERGEGLTGGAAHFDTCSVVTITNSTFENLTAGQGGALHFEAVAVTLIGQALIDNCRFVKNEADIGGAVYAIDHKMTIINSLFTKNNATEGGALYFDCSAACVYSITNSTFRTNSATVRGGAVAWLMAQPTVQNVNFENNTAFYGPDLASFPLLVQVDNITQTEIAPGQVLDSMVLASLHDHYSQVVAIDNSSIARLTASFTNVTVFGETKVKAAKGHFLFDKFQVYAQPNSSVMLTVMAANAQTAQQMTLSVRDCRPGEFRMADSCAVCSSGTYSFEPVNPCLVCPRNALCLGGSTVIPISGYWRSSELSPELRECPNQQACLGGKADSDPLSLVGRCARGYQGNLCQSCQDGFSRSGKNICEKCPPKDLNVARLTGLTVVVIVAMSLVVWSALRSATRPAAIHSILIRILVNYLQLVALLSEFKLNWPLPVLELFDSQGKVEGVSEQLYSVDCFLNDEKMSADTYYRKTTYMVIMPCGAIAAAVVFWTLVAILKKSTKVLTRQCVSTIVILFFLVLPDIIQAMFSTLSCVEIEKGQFWLTTVMDIPCWDSQHYKALLTVVLPGIAVWIIAVPLLCLSLLVKSRKTHDETSLRIRFGFITNGYLPGRYYWEFVILYRKVLVISASIFISTSISIQALSVQLVLLVALFAQYKMRPFNSKLLNSVELRELLVADVTIFCGLYFLTNDISPTAQWFFFAMIVGSNAIFLIYWIVGMLGHMTFLLSKHLKLVESASLIRDEEVENMIELMTPTAVSGLEIADKNLYDCYRNILMGGISVNMFRSRKYRMWPYYSSSSFDFAT